MNTRRRLILNRQILATMAMLLAACSPDSGQEAGSLKRRIILWFQLIARVARKSLQPWREPITQLLFVVRLVAVLRLHAQRIDSQKA